MASPSSPHSESPPESSLNSPLIELEDSEYTLLKPVTDVKSRNLVLCFDGTGNGLGEGKVHKKTSRRMIASMTDKF